MSSSGFNREMKDESVSTVAPGAQVSPPDSQKANEDATGKEDDHNGEFPSGSQQSTVIELDISAESVEAVEDGRNAIVGRSDSVITEKECNHSSVNSVVPDIPKNRRVGNSFETQEKEYNPVKKFCVGEASGVKSVVVAASSTARPISSAVRRNGLTGLFHGGFTERSSFTAKHLSVHDPLEASVPFLSTTNDGILHVLPGWTSSMLLQDLCYRFTTAGSWGASVPFVPILASEESHTVRKRKYQCNGVKVCPLVPGSYRHARHSTREEYDALQREAAELGNYPEQSNLMVLQRARSVYLSVSRQDRKYCMFIGKDPSDANKPLACSGSPIIRTNRMTGEEFLGCTGYRTNFKDPHPTARGNSKVHASRSLRDIGASGKELLHSMLLTGNAKVDSTETCFYVTQKSSRRTTCPAHGYTLQETGACPAQMLVVEPVWQQQVSFRPDDLARGQIPDRSKLITYAMCRGEHFHPPPPPPLATGKKAQLIVHEALNSRDANPAVIKLRTQLELDKQGGAYGKAISVDNDQLYTILGAMRQSGRIPDCRDAQSLLGMVADASNDYVRDITNVEDGFVVILGSDEMFEHALTAGIFAGDATYKIVTESRRTVKEMNWYLYNIVTRTHTAAIGTHGVVVSRFLMNRLSSSFYRAVWCLFFDNLRRVLSRRLGVPRSLISLSVPYLPTPPGQAKYTVNVWSITVDFDVSEIEGIAMALEDERGGTRETHIQSMLVGCFVHFERDAKRRSSRMNGDKKESLYNVMLALHGAKTAEDAELYWEVIKGMDPEWALWSKRRSMKPLVIPAYSKMNEEYRSLAFKDTNIVESQNRRANYLCGIQLDVAVAAMRLREADVVTIKAVQDGRTVPEARFPKPRRRTLSIAAPTPGSVLPQKKKRRSTTGLTAIRQKNRTQKRSNGGSSVSGCSYTAVMEEILRVLSNGISSLSGSSKTSILISLAIKLGKETVPSSARIIVLETLSANSEDKEISAILSAVLEASFLDKPDTAQDIPCITLDSESE